MGSVSDRRLCELPYHERVGVVRDEIARITTRVGDLDGDLLDRPAVGDWTVRAVLAHLVVVAELYTNSITRGASGNVDVSGDLPQPGTGRGALVAGGLREQATQLADAFDAAVIDKLRSGALVLADTLDTDESSLEYDCYHPGGIIPANRFMVLFLKELGLHEWDIFEALQPPCTMNRWGVDAAIQAMEEELASGSLRWLTDPDGGPDTLTFRVITSGDVAVERDLLLEPHQTRLVAVDEQRNVDSWLRLTAADFVLGCSGRRAFVNVVTEGRGEGDLDALHVLDRRLTGM
jgi:uncharacterized protein (TIGR03083 family)